MARLASSQEAAPVCPGSGPLWDHKSSLRATTTREIFLLLFFPLKIQSHFRFLLCIFTPDQKNATQTNETVSSEWGWLVGKILQLGGRDVDIDLHSKRVGSLIKQRFVAKELVLLLLPKRKRAKRETGKWRETRLQTLHTADDRTGI